MEKVAFVVREANKEDIPQIQIVSKEAFKMYIEGAGITDLVGPLNETYEYLEEELNTKLVFVAMEQDTVIGCVRVEIQGEGTAYLSRFGVSPAYQSKGIGKLLMQAVDDAMEAMGIERLYLHTASRMLALVRFYYARGFYIESTTKNKGYIRALLCKEYEIASSHISTNVGCENLAIN